MKILLIDNHSKHREELKHFFRGEIVVETQDKLCDIDISFYDLIILSGGSNIPSVLYNPDAYIKEIEFIKNTTKPILGICLGNEIIVEAFGGKLQDLGAIHRGEITISIDDDELKKYLNKDFLQVYEAHEVVVKDMPEDFIICAHSEHGVEIIKHKSKKIVGVQFHPEVEPNVKFLEWLIKTLL